MPNDQPPPIDLDLPADFAAPPPVPAAPADLPVAVPVVRRYNPSVVSQPLPDAPRTKPQIFLAMMIFFGVLAVGLVAVVVLMAAIYADFKTYGLPGAPPRPVPVNAK